MSTYYNDNDPFAAAWLRELIAAGHLPPGDVDERSIIDVQPDDVLGYDACHFFAGIGGWPFALQLAGWPADRPVWTASLPCQPFSPAGKGEGHGDARNLWPVFYRLVRECRPERIFGEQVEAAIGFGWLDGVCLDLEGLDYACGAAVLPACSVGAPHIRSRLYWVADTTSHRLQGKLRESGGDPEIRRRTPQALDAWHGASSPFEHWKILLAKPNAIRVDDGVSSTVDIRPRLHAYGNAIVPQVAAAFVSAFLAVEYDRGHR